MYHYQWRMRSWKGFPVLKEKHKDMWIELWEVVKPVVKPYSHGGSFVQYWLLLMLWPIIRGPEPDIGKYGWRIVGPKVQEEKP